MLPILKSRVLGSFILFAVSVSFVNSALAGQRVDIYRADTLVKSQNEVDRNAAARATLGEIVVRVSGRGDALSNPVVQAAASKAQRYLSGFSYRSSNEKIVEAGKTYPAIGLQLNYTPQMIEQLLRDAQLPVWPAQRPSLLVWLVYKDENGLHRVAPATDLQVLQAQAQYRGLPLVFPSLDREDSFALTVGDLWSLDYQKIRQASARYNADRIFVGRYTPARLGSIPHALSSDAAVERLALRTNTSYMLNKPVLATAASANPNDNQGAFIQGAWLSDWRLLDMNGDNSSSVQAYSGQATDVAGVFIAAINVAADYFSDRYAITPSQRGPATTLLSVRNLSNFGAYKKLQTYLKGLEMVKRLELLKVDQQETILRLTIEGDEKLLINTLALGRRLVPVSGGYVPASTKVDANTHDLDATALAELEQALARERRGADGSVPVEHQQVPQLPAAESVLNYIWQN